MKKVAGRLRVNWKNASSWNLQGNSDRHMEKYQAKEGTFAQHDERPRQRMHQSLF